MWSQLKQYCTTGLSPFTAQVRTRVGRCENPDSSMKTISRPSLRAFFEPWPGALLPVHDRHLVAFQRTALRLLAGKTHLPEQAPDMHFAVPNPELALDEHAYSLECPQRRAKAVRGGAFHQGNLQSPQFLRSEQARPSAFAHVAQRVDPLGFQHILPAVYRLPRRADYLGHFGRLVSGLQ